MTDVLSYLNAVRAFEAAARHESFAKAAQELCVSHTVVSRHVRNLEGWLGTALFERSGNRVMLTEEARMIAPRVTASLLEVKEVFEQVRRTRSERRVRVSAEPAFASRWLRRHAGRFRDAHPDIGLEIKASWTPERVDDELSDVVVHFQGRMNSAVADSDLLFPIDGFPACAPSLAEAFEGKSDRPWFEALPLVHDHGFNIWRTWFERYQPTSEAWKQGQVYADLSLAIDAAVDGEGVILADDRICQKEVKTGTLVKLDPRVVRCTWYAVRTSLGRPRGPAVEAFLSWLQDEAQD